LTIILLPKLCGIFLLDFWKRCCARFTASWRRTLRVPAAWQWRAFYCATEPVWTRRIIVTCRPSCILSMHASSMSFSVTPGFNTHSFTHWLARTHARTHTQTLMSSVMNSAADSSLLSMFFHCVMFIAARNDFMYTTSKCFQCYIQLLKFLWKLEKNTIKHAVFG